MVGQAGLKLVRLRRDQWLDPPALKRLQFERLRALLEHAYGRVAYYRRLFDSVGVKPDDIRSLEDFQSIPVTTRAQLQDLPTDQIVAQGISIERCLSRRTSGSTGRPLAVYVSPEEKLHQTLVSLRILLENGLRFSDKLVYISTSRHFSPQDRWFQRLGILRRRNVSMFDDLKVQTQIIRETEPDVLYGYPSSLVTLGKSMEVSPELLVKPRLIFTTAERLHPETRQFLNAVFGADVYDVYGAIEFGDIAWECEQREGYHINADCLVVELVRNGQRVLPGELGELVCTGLHSYAMPLIRYKLGDVCVLSDDPCSCGRGLPLMKVIEGRADDFVSLLDGRVVSPLVLTSAVKRVTGIKRYRMVQEKEGILLVQIVGSETLSPGMVHQALGEICRDRLEIVVELVDEIPRGNADKFRPIVSKVAKGF